MTDNRQFRLRYHQWDAEASDFRFLGEPERRFARSELEALLDIHRQSESNRWKIEVQTQDGSGQWFTVELHELPLSD
jgi:hypothetical protein